MLGRCHLPQANRMLDSTSQSMTHHAKPVVADGITPCQALSAASCDDNWNAVQHSVAHYGLCRS